MAQELNNTQTNTWSNDQIESDHPSSVNPLPPSSQHQKPKIDQIEQRPQPQIEEAILQQAKTFYYRYKSAIMGMNNRRDLQRLFEDTFSSWASSHDQQDPPNFSKVLYALAHGMKIVRVIDAGKSLLWKIERSEHDSRDRDFDDRRRGGHTYDVDRRDQRPDHREQRPDHRHQERIDRDQQRPERPDHRHQERIDRDQQRPERPDHRHQERIDRDQQRHQDRQERPDHHRQERRQDESSNLAEIVSNQQKMIEALMSKVMKTG